MQDLKIEQTKDNWMRTYFEFLEDLKVADALINRDGIIGEHTFAMANKLFQYELERIAERVIGEEEKHVWMCRMDGEESCTCRADAINEKRRHIINIFNSEGIIK